MRNHYEILGVETTVTQEELKVVYKKLALQFHPDRNQGSPVAESTFKEINEAYQVLSDNEKRVVYDFNQRLTRAPKIDWSSSSSKNIHSVLDDLFQHTDFGVPFKASRRKQPSTQEVFQKDIPGDNILDNLEISLEESISGCKKPIKIRGPRPNTKCSFCNGTGAKIGSRRITCTKCLGYGKYLSHSRLTNSGLQPCDTCDGSGSVPLERCKSCDGHGKITYEKEITVQIPVGIASGQELRIAGQGTPGHPPGDLFITV